MNYFIKNIKINKLFHLQDIDIPVSDESCPHLIITGKNGSGKTILLNAISDFLEEIKDDSNMHFTKYKEWLVNDLKRKEKCIEQQERIRIDKEIKNDRQRVDKLYGRVELVFLNVADVIEKYQSGNFLITFYQADRKSKMSEPKNPTKPVYNKQGEVRETATGQFLNFLSDLKIQEALARNEKQVTDADEIRDWFVDFETLLKQIYQDDKLKLEFNYKDYSFKINTGGKSFKFTEMSDGFAAVLDIVADLILKMQDDKSLVRVYQKQGIVLIDEIETHLHLALQKIIMPILTKVFPNIQFIITTHSPFVLSSMDNAIAFDLEHREVINELTEYSYEALAEGYFGVRTEASYMEMQLNTLQELLSKKEITVSDKVAIQQLVSDFEKIPESISPLLIGRYRQIKIKYASIIKGL
ncbi:AAA family ATPase [Butyricimonas paravirosa]|uniref:AAA family ATPase n=1 Tax=Butyricimonas paravirosa TaxID=1472417 RepID=UPI0035230699